MKVCGKEIKVSGKLVRIARLDADKYLFVDDPESVINALRASQQRIDLFTFIQRVNETLPKYPYPMEWDNFAVLPVSTFDHWWTKQVDAKTRNMVRKAEKKSVILREVSLEDSLAHGIWRIYNESSIRQGRRFPHYGKDQNTVYREAATYLERSQFIGAFLDEELIGFIKLVWDEPGTQVGLMNIMSLIQHRDKAANNALLAAAVRFCGSRHISSLVYSNFAYGKKQGDSLSEFKRNNGFQQVDVPRYYVPLTLWGQLAFRLGLHHRFVDRLPESIAAKLRAYREAWYKHRLNSAEAF